MDNEAEHSADRIRTEVLTKDEGPQTGEDSGLHKHDVYNMLPVARMVSTILFPITSMMSTTLLAITSYKHDVKHKETASML